MGGTDVADSYEYSGATWTAMSSRPSSRGYSSMVYDSARNKLVLYGGYGGAVYLGDTWEY